MFGTGLQTPSRLDVYAHLRPRDLAEAVAVLDRPRNEVSRSGFTRQDTDREETKKPALTG